jgi:hypothetical protein
MYPYRMYPVLICKTRDREKGGKRERERRAEEREKEVKERERNK